VRVRWEQEIKGAGRRGAHLMSRVYCFTYARSGGGRPHGRWERTSFARASTGTNPYTDGQSRSEFVRSHEACRRICADRVGREETCRCLYASPQGNTGSTAGYRRRYASAVGGCHTKHGHFVLDRDEYICQMGGLPTHKGTGRRMTSTGIPEGSGEGVGSYILPLPPIVPSA
jgi:hypothetical protein